ncbi:MAG: ankyrin repeat domain-containing protein [Oligoflexales bacterium]
MKPVDWLFRHTTLALIVSLNFSSTGYGFFASYYNKVKQAVKTENLNNLKNYLSNISDSNTKSLEKPLDEDGETFLTHAIAMEKDNVAFSFIDAKILINHPNKKKMYPLEVAIQNEKTEILERLISVGANLDVTENLRTKVIHYIFKKNHKSLISRLVNSDRELNLLDDEGNTPLMTALKNGHKTLVISKISPRIAINQVNNNDETLLGFALETHDHSFLEMLLSLNADINQKTRFNSLDDSPVLPPLTYGIIVEDYKLVEKLISSKKLDWEMTTESEETFVNTSTRLGRNEILSLLVRSGANYRQPDKQGNTPLINACKEKNEKIVKKLIALGTDINFANLDGRTAISYAIEMDSVSIVERLINAHADLSEKNYLFYAIINHSYQIAKILLDAGADPNLKALYPNKLAKLKDPELSTPLYHAMESEDFDIIKLLLGYEQTDITIRNNNYTQSYLHKVISIGNIEIVKLFLKQDSSTYDLEFKNENGDTPLLIAAKKGFLEIVKILLDMGADINASNAEGLNVFSITKSKQPKIYAFLDYFGAKSNGSLEDIEEYFNESNTEQDLNDLFNLLLKKYNNINGYLLSDHLVTLIDSIDNYDLLIYLKGLLTTYTKLDESRNEYLTKRLNKLMVAKQESILDQTDEKDYSAYAYMELKSYENRCTLCKKAINEAKTYHGPAGCKHVTCKSCFHKYLEQSLAEHEGKPLACPTCKETLTTEFIAGLDLKPKDINEIRLLQIKNRLASVKNFKFCPTQDCLGGKTVASEEDRFYSCPICDFEGCIVCSSKHDGSCTK